MENVLVQDLVNQLKDVENEHLWLEENFEKKLAEITELNAFVRPSPGLHSVAELLSHLITWRRVNIRRTQGEILDIPDEHPDNWKSNEELKPMGWDALKADFYASQQEVLNLLQGKDDSFLTTSSTYNGESYKYLLQGLVHHDFYHLGQLGLTVKYLRRSIL